MVKLNEVIRQVDVVITCTGEYQRLGTCRAKLTLRLNLKRDTKGNTCLYEVSDLKFSELLMFSKRKSFSLGDFSYFVIHIFLTVCASSFMEADVSQVLTGNSWYLKCPASSSSATLLYFRK